MAQKAHGICVESEQKLVIVSTAKQSLSLFGCTNQPFQLALTRPCGLQKDCRGLPASQ
jgi:hypothetical protein